MTSGLCGIFIITNDRPLKATKVRTSVGTVITYKKCTTKTIAYVMSRSAARMGKMRLVPTSVVTKRVHSFLKSIKTSYVGVNVLCSGGVVQLITNVLSRCDSVPIIISPIVIASSNSGLLRRSTIRTCGSCLFPHASVLAPGGGRTR